MLMSLRSWINLSLVLFSTSTLAGANYLGDAVDVSLSGFAFTTIFGDQEWNDGKTRVALNLDAATNNWRLNAQVGNDDDGNHPVRRLFIEYSHPSRDQYTSTTHHIKAGRFQTLESFYNNAADTPASSGMDILPLAGYNYKFQDGTFTSIDGIGYQQIRKYAASLITIRAAYGSLYIDDKKNLNTYLFGSYLSGIDITTDKKSHNYSLHYEDEHRHFFYAKSRYAASLETFKGATPLEQYLSMATQDISYETDRYGARYESGVWYAQAEYILGKTIGESNKNMESYGMLAKDYYIQLGYSIDDNYTVYTGMSEGRATEKMKIFGPTQVSKKFADDIVVGVTRDGGHVVSSIAYHHGHGRAYAKIGSKTNAWSSWVFSTTYRF